MKTPSIAPWVTGLSLLALGLSACALPSFGITSGSGATSSASSGGGGSGGTTTTLGGSAGAGGTGATGAGGTGATGTGGTGATGTGGSTASGTGGAGGGCPGTPGCTLWADAFVGVGEDRAYGLAALLGGGLAVGGRYGSQLGQTITFPPQMPLSCAGDADAFGAALSPEGACIAQLTIGGSPNEPSSEVIRAVAVDPADGSIIIAGEFGPTIDAPSPIGGMLTSYGGKDVFVGKLTKAGVGVWGKHFGTVSDDTVSGVAVDSAHDIVVTGTYLGTLTFGSLKANNHGGAADSQDIYLGKLSPDGEALWLDTCGGTGKDVSYGVTVDSKNAVILAGSFDATLQCDNIGASLTPSGGTDGLVVHFNGDGQTGGWFKGIVGMGSGERYARAIASDGVATIYVAGDFHKGINLGNGGAFVDQPNTPTDVFLLGLNATTGVQVWSKVFEDVGLEADLALAAAPGGGLVLAGSYSGTTTFGAPKVAAAGIDAFVARLGPAPDGALSWQRVMSGGGTQSARAVAFDPQGNVLVAGDFDGTTDLGKGPVTAAGLSDVFAVKLAP